MANRRAHPLSLLALVWGLFIVYGTSLPFDFSGSASSIADSMQRMLRGIHEPRSLPDVVSNVLLFVPLGGLLTARGLLLGRSSVAGLLIATLAGFLLSSSVEILQLVQPRRTPSILDVIYNTGGSFLGGLFAVLTVRSLLAPASRWISRAVATRPLACVAALAVALIGIAGLQPFDFSLDVGDLKTAVKSARVVPFGEPIRGTASPYPWWKVAQDVLPWALVGGTLALAVGERRRRPATAVMVGATAGAAALAVAVELAQLVVGQRVTDATTVLLATVGAAAGAAVTVAIDGSRRPRRCWAPAVAAWCAMLVVAAWTPPPYDWPRSFSWWSLVPFYEYYVRMNVNAVADLIREAAAMVPFGALLAYRFPGKPRRVAVVGFLLVGGLELGQLFVPARTADITDAVTAGLGAWVGALLFARAMRARRSR